MAPVKDIRSFFKPADKTARKETPQPDSNAARIWPSPHTAKRHGESAALNRDSPSPSTAPANRAVKDERETPETASLGAPSNSQSSVNLSFSKKVIVNGEKMILNSDSDSDSDPLEELVFSIKKRSPPTKTSGGKAPVSSLHARPIRTYRYGMDDELRKPPPKSKNTKPSLSRLVEAAQKHAAAEQKMAELKAELEKPLEVPVVENGAIDEDTLAGVVNDEDGEDKAKRLYRAMQRTNALDTECIFHFFGNKPRKGTRRAPFPLHSLPRHGWAANFEDSWKRDQVFLSGFAQQIFKHQSLPEELARWMFDEISSGRSNGLTSKYIQLLEAHPKYLESNLTKSQLNTIFFDLGADVQCLEQQITPAYEPLHTPKKPVPLHIRGILQLLRSAAKCLSPDPRKHVLLILFHLCMDDSVISDAAMLHAVQDAIESILRYIPDRDSMLTEVVQSLLTHITHPVLQNLLVTSLSSRTPMTAAFRRQLAFSFLIYPTPLTVSLSDSNFAALIHKHLDTSKTFKVTRETNYASLAASLSLLDIGIGPGPMAVPCQPPPVEGESASKFLGKEEIAFNKEIDALAQHIKLLGNKIVEAGAISDLTRLEAKDCGERLCHRLENAVRIGGRKKRSAFDLDDEGEGSRRLFKKWVKKTDGGSTTPSTPGVDAGVKRIKSEDDGDDSRGIKVEPDGDGDVKMES